MKRTMARTLDKMARLARESPVDMVDCCTVLDIAPSTFYNYVKFVTRRYQDIVYEEGMLKSLDNTEKQEI